MLFRSQYFPGVPVFFLVSGFLIFWSFDRNQNEVRKFYRNRFLRLYPALWVCLLVAAVLLVLDYPFEKTQLLFSGDFSKWFLAQATFFQFYTPDSLRFWGVGAPNGSLWTITVELQFYMLVPILFYFFKRLGKYWKTGLFALITISLGCNIFIDTLNDESMLRKLGGVFILPYLYYFLCGILIYKYWDRIRSLFEGIFLYWFIAYFIFYSVFGVYFEFNISSYWVSSPLKLLADILLMSLTVSFAFTKISLSHTLLRGNDISYGVYIYHMLVVNYFVQHQYIKEVKYFFFAYLLTLISGFLSWIFVEKRIMTLKKKTS